MTHRLSATINPPILDATPADRPPPGADRGEKAGARAFDVIGTVARNTVIALEMCEPFSCHRIWFVVQLSPDEFLATVQSRRGVETGSLHAAGNIFRAERGDVALSDWSGTSPLCLRTDHLCALEIKRGSP
jgi:hypothetical protein